MIKMKLLVILLISMSTIYSILPDDWNCDVSKQDAINLFKKKVILNPYPEFESDPYLNQTSDVIEMINKTLNDKNLVCAIKYKNQQRIEYETKNFRYKQEAIDSGFIVTHQGRCGACSSLNDLAVYLSGDLTTPTRKCGMLGALSAAFAMKCLLDIGFSENCAQIWLYNTINTRKNCFAVCIAAWILDEPFTKPDGTLNGCLECDEIKSGPIFKYFSGRTRRNSGIRSEIDRPSDEIYNVTHCYY
jgi:hypothetical protein